MVCKRAVLVLAVVAAGQCSCRDRSARAPSPDAALAAPRNQDAMHDESDLDPLIATRLRKPGKKLAPLAYDFATIDRERHGVLATHAVSSDRPPIWLLVFRFASGTDAEAAGEPIQSAIERRRAAPFRCQRSVMGRHLLVAGFASDDPPTPERQAALDAYLSAFAGEE